MAIPMSLFRLRTGHYLNIIKPSVKRISIGPGVDNRSGLGDLIYYCAVVRGGQIKIETPPLLPKWRDIKKTLFKMEKYSQWLYRPR